MITTKAERRRARKSASLAAIKPRVRVRCWWCKSRFVPERMQSHRETVHADLLAAEDKRKNQIQRRLTLDRQNVRTLADLGKIRAQFRPA